MSDSSTTFFTTGQYAAGWAHTRSVFGRSDPRPKQWKLSKKRRAKRREEMARLRAMGFRVSFYRPGQADKVTIYEPPVQEDV